MDFDFPPLGGLIWTQIYGKKFWGAYDPLWPPFWGVILDPKSHWSKYWTHYPGLYGYIRMTPLGVRWGPWGPPLICMTKLKIRPPGGPWGSFFRKSGSDPGPPKPNFLIRYFYGVNAKGGSNTSILRGFCPKLEGIYIWPHFCNFINRTFF